MAEDASEYLATLRTSLSSFVASTFFFQHFERKTELLAYLILCVAKMPFIPPVSIARSVSGLAWKERHITVDNTLLSTTSLEKTKLQREDRGGSVKERLASNLKQLGKKKSLPRSHLPIAKGVSGSELMAKRHQRLMPLSQTNSFPASRSSESLAYKTLQHKHMIRNSAKWEPEVRAKVRQPEEARFTLTLTPEAVLLLQRRNSEKRQNSAPSVCGEASDYGRKREKFPNRRQQPQRHSTPSSRVSPPKSNSEGELRDISSIVKISLLNEQHKYDDVEYEEEEDYGVDERVVMKCTEWLRGLENTPVTVGKRLSKSTSRVKSF